MVHNSAAQAWLDTSAPNKYIDEYACENSAAEANRNEVVERTSSQVSKQAKISSVLERLEGQKAPIQELCRTVSELGRSADLGSEESGSANSLREVAARVDQTLKRARNFGEDLLEDLLSLDGLSGLIAEDRARRKRAIAELDALLEDVDAAKQRLGGLHKQLQADLNALAVGSEQAREPDTHMQNSGAGQREYAAEAAQATRQPLAPNSAPQGQPGWPLPDLSLPPPSRELWNRVELPVRFEVRELVGGFELRASVPGLEKDDIGLDLGRDGSTLTVSGLRAPSSRKAEQLHRQLSAWVRQQVQRSPQKARSIASRLAEIAREGYAELAQGAFGRFSKTFQVPQNADTSCIQARYRDDVLHVFIPKRGRRTGPRGLVPMGHFRPL